MGRHSFDSDDTWKVSHKKFAVDPDADSAPYRSSQRGRSSDIPVTEDAGKDFWETSVAPVDKLRESTVAPTEQSEDRRPESAWPGDSVRIARPSAPTNRSSNPPAENRPEQHAGMGVEPPSSERPNEDWASEANTTIHPVVKLPEDAPHEPESRVLDPRLEQPELASNARMPDASPHQPRTSHPRTPKGCAPDADSPDTRTQNAASPGANSPHASSGGRRSGPTPMGAEQQDNAGSTQGTAVAPTQIPRQGARQGVTSDATAGSQPGSRRASRRPARGRRDVAAEAVRLTKRYGQGEAVVTALDGVSVQFLRGEFTAIMGPSGSGKSTLMHCMAGLDSASGGQAFIGDTDLSTLKDKEMTALRRDRLGFIFQSFNLVPTLTAKENITLSSDIAGEKVDERWFTEITTRLGLSERLSHRPAELSGGQQQRVACARALVSRPEIIFGDEPTGNLDSNSSAEVLDILRTAVDQDDQTVVIVTHDPRAASYADRVLFLADGQVVSELRDPSIDEIAATMTGIEN